MRIVSSNQGSPKKRKMSPTCAGVSRMAFSEYPVRASSFCSAVFLAIQLRLYVGQVESGQLAFAVCLYAGQGCIFFGSWFHDFCFHCLLILLLLSFLYFFLSFSLPM